MISEEDKKRYVKLCLQKYALYNLQKHIDSPTDEQRQRWYDQDQRIQSQIRHMFSYLCAIPEKFKDIVMWMVDVQAISTCPIDGKELQKALDSSRTSDPVEAVRGIMTKVGGDLYKDVNQQLESRGFHISDRGGGKSGWHVGVWCTSEDADKLIAFVNEYYKVEIENYVIGLRRMPWSFGFKGLHFQDEIIEYARAHNISA